MDKIIISGLEIETVIGVLAWEREIKQKIILDVELSVDITAAAATDDISKAVDYSILSQQVTEFIEATEYQLIETLAENTAKFILKNFPIKDVKLTLAKPGAIKTAKSVAVVIERIK